MFATASYVNPTWPISWTMTFYRWNWRRCCRLNGPGGKRRQILPMKRHRTKYRRRTLYSSVCPEQIVRRRFLVSWQFIDRIVDVCWPPEYRRRTADVGDDGKLADVDLNRPRTFDRDVDCRADGVLADVLRVTGGGQRAI